MNEHPMMKCGCAASAVLTTKGGVKLDKPILSCPIHMCDEIGDTPDLTARIARCAYGDHAHKRSSPDLAFFEYRGPGSRWATEICQCGYTEAAHEKPHITKHCKTGFTPRGPAPFDVHYCGCHGWD